MFRFFPVRAFGRIISFESLFQRNVEIGGNGCETIKGFMGGMLLHCDETALIKLLHNMGTNCVQLS